MKIIRFLSTLLFGIILGFVLTVGGVALGGYLLWTKEGSIGKITDFADNTLNLPLDFDEDIRAKSLSGYVTEIMTVLGDIGNSQISEIERFAGSDFLSKGLSDFVGIEQNIIRPALVSELGSVISHNLTVRTISDRFDIELASMPVFQDDEFLDSPISSAFVSLEERPLDRFIQVIYDEDVLADPALTPSPQLLQSLGTVSLGEISRDFGTILDDMTVGELVAVEFEGEDKSSKILIYLSDKKLSELDSAINTMKLSDAIEIRPTSHAVLRAISEDSLETLADTEHMTEVINALKLEDFIEITNDDEPILIALRETPIGELSTAMEELTVKEIFRSSTEGVLCLVHEDTKLQDIPEVLSEAVANTSLYALSAVGLFNITTPVVTTRNTVYNSTVEDVVNSYAQSKLPQDSLEWIILYDTVVPDWCDYHPILNRPFVKRVDLAELEVSGFIEKIDVTMDSSTVTSVWKISQNTLDNFYGPNDPALPGSMFFPVGDINIVIEADPLLPEENTFNQTFSFNMDYLVGASDLSKVLIGNDIQIIIDRGGYMSFSNIQDHVYSLESPESSNYVQLSPGVNEPTFIFKMVKEDAVSDEIPNILVEYDPF